MDSSKPIKITLFHMTDCIHCDNFKPEWEKLSSTPQKNIAFADFESGSMGNMSDQNQTINGVPIMGYPTIKIEVLDKEYDYGDKRDQTTILEFVRDKLKNRISGVETEVEGETEIDRDTSDEVQLGGHDGEGDGEGENEEAGEETSNAEPEEDKEISEDKESSEDNEEGSPKDNEDQSHAGPVDVLVSLDTESETKTESEQDGGANPISSSIFSKPVTRMADNDFRMSEFDRLLVKEINIMSDMPFF
jgi:hypothetical protein